MKLGISRWRLIVFSGIAFATVAKSGEQTPKSWSVKMRELESTLQELLVDVSSDERFYSPKNFKRIEANAEKFSKLAHAINVSSSDRKFVPDSDPSVLIMAGEFSKEANHAYKTLTWGHRAYARELLKSMTGYCIACHTRNGSGPEFQSGSDHPWVKDLKLIDQANYFASIRQFDRALEEYEKVITKSENVALRTFEWSKALRSGLAIAVRVKKDPSHALKLVDRVLSEPKAPFFMKEEAIQWKKSLRAWELEKDQKPQNEDGYFALATRLIKEARELQKYPADRAADILYLRASSAVHDLLGIAPNGRHAAEAYYLAGLCYEVLQGLNLWDIHEFYFMACILKAPHTEISRKCFQHYEQSVYLGFTGSGGLNLPSEIRTKLQSMDFLSLPTSPQEPIPTPEGVLR